MRIQLASDLHLEHLQHDFAGERLIEPASDADVLVLAGDIANGLQAVDLFKDWPVPVIYVAGNHEFYGHSLSGLRSKLREATDGTPIRFLDNDVTAFSGLRFLGTTLWTDYRLPLNRTQRQLMENAQLRLSDHFEITYDGEWFAAADALKEHERSRRWLESELACPYEGATIVVTHHGPHPLSVHPRYSGDALNAAFASNLDDLMARADVWLHGHVHDSVDYRLGKCRVVANPRGYALHPHASPAVANLIFENRAFTSTYLIEV